MRKNILFLGVGGIGVSALAIAAQKLGANIVGYDSKKTKLTQHLENLSIKIFTNISELDIKQFDTIVYSSAISLNSPIILEAKKHNITTLQRAVFLAEIMQDFNTSIAITGTHGKTTTSSILASLLISLDSQNSFIVGGMVKATNSNIAINGNTNLVIEADESDASFLHLNPTIAVVTNIDLDHMATYANSYENLLEKFSEFLNKNSIQTIIICIDDNGCLDLLDKYSFDNKQVITYGFSKNADIKIENYKVVGGKSLFTITATQYAVNLPGQYNVLNATATIACALKLGFSAQDITMYLDSVQGVARRFDIHNICIDSKNINVVDDYGHHPVEVSSCIQAVRDRFADKKIIHIFQPHRYSRNKDLFNDWVKSLANSDILILLPTYSAGELEIAGATSKDFATSLQNCTLANDFDDAIFKLRTNLTDDSVVLVQGAGDVTNIIDILKNEQ